MLQHASYLSYPCRSFVVSTFACWSIQHTWCSLPLHSTIHNLKLTLVLNPILLWPPYHTVAGCHAHHRRPNISISTLIHRDDGSLAFSCCGIWDFIWLHSRLCLQTLSQGFIKFSSTIFERWTILTWMVDLRGGRSGNGRQALVVKTLSRQRW